jgi:hypothetical protein
MDKRITFSLACMALLPAWCQAQAALDANDPQVRVPATQYRSVFKDTPTGVESEQQDWKKANAEVGQFLRGHIDLLKLEEQNLKPGTPAAPALAPAPPAVRPAQPAASGTHKH